MDAASVALAFTAGSPLRDPDRFVFPARLALSQNAFLDATYKCITPFQLHDFQGRYHRAKFYNGPYVYSPLDNPAGQIRLLILGPSLYRESPIACRLFNCDLDRLAGLHYEALSYTWGPPEDGSGAISIEGKSMNVRINLWWALYHLRFHDRERVLWIDALCIDQSNVLERNHQVRQMSSVYSQADTVIMWLGQENDEDALAFAYLRQLEESFGVELEDDVFAALETLCNRGYWRRLWVVQEIVLAKQLVLQSGDVTATWTALSAALTYMSKHVLGDAVKDSLPSRFGHQRKDRYYECRLLKLLEACQNCECGDLRDKVYGLLGLANDCSEQDLTVDYSKSIFEVYEDVVLFQSHGTRNKEYLGSFKRDIHAVRFSQMIQKSLQMSPEDDQMSCPVGSQASKRLVQQNYQQLIYATGVDAGEIAIIECLPSDALLENAMVTRSHILMSRFPDLTEEDISKVVNIESSLSYGLRKDQTPPKRISPNGVTHPYSSPSVRRSRKYRSRLAGLNAKQHPQIFQIERSTENSHNSPGTPCVAIGPSRIRKGDRVVQFIDCDVALIIRPQKGYYSIVGRALVIKEQCNTVQMRCDVTTPRALNAQSIMSNRPDDFPYCIWHPDLAAEATYPELTCRDPHVRYRMGRAFFPTSPSPEEARDNQKNGGEISDEITAQPTRYVNALLRRPWYSRYQPWTRRPGTIRTEPSLLVIILPVLE